MAALCNRALTFCRSIAARKARPVCFTQSATFRVLDHDLDYPPVSPVASPVPGDNYGPNDKIEPQVFNRNPRNLELLRLARKPQGWTLEQGFKEYWYRLVLDRTLKHTTARLEHFTGKAVVTVSTSDWDVRQVIGKTNDLAAVKVLGKIFASRCLMAGFNEFHSDYGHEVRASSEKINAFITALEESGLSLSEPPVIDAPLISDPKKKEWAWDVLEEDVMKEVEKASVKAS